MKQVWNIDTTHSSVGFSVRHMVFAKVRGRFAGFRGALRLDPEDLPHSSVEVEMDAATIDTGVADRDNHLRSPDFFNAEQHPHLRFRSSGVEHVEAQHFRVHGELTIRDVTREVVLEVEYGGQAKDPWGNDRAAFTASTSINRGDFGLTWNQALEAGGVLVSDRVDIELDLQAVKAAAAEAA
jgi:polyisoprenoid-binding protein YceI